MMYEKIEDVKKEDVAIGCNSLTNYWGNTNTKGSKGI